MHGSEFDGVVSLALLGARIVVLRPWLDAGGAEEGLTAVALLGILYDHGTDGADEEVGSFSLLLVLLDQVLDVEMRFWLSAV